MRHLWILCLCLWMVSLAIPAEAFAQSPDQVLASFDEEPSILEVQHASLAYAGIDDGMIDNWYTRANTAKILPDRLQYRLSVRNNTRELSQFDEDLDERGTLTKSDSRQEERTEDRIEHRIEANWDLSEIVFNPDILRVSREAGRLVNLREDVLSSVTKLYYERRRQQVEFILNPPGDTSERLRQQLQIQELTAEIDALTGGWFSGELRAANKDPY